MSTAKKNAKGNKTAHVLNLLTAPGAAKETAAPSGEETAAEGAVPEASAPSRPLLPPILEVAQANDDNLAQQIQQALEEELVPDTPAAPEPSIPPAGKESKTEEVSPPMATQPASSGKMSQDEIEKLLAAANAPAEPAAPEPAPAPPPSSGGKMSQDEIEKLLAAANAPAEPAAPEPAPAPPPSSGGKMSQDEIEKLLAAANAPAEPATPEPAPAPPPPSGGKMSQDEIEKLLAAANAPEEKAAPAPEPPKPAPVPEEEDVSYINIMQALVDEKAPSYIKKFGLCTCKHCEADVKALTLTNLVPKYVVLSKLDRIPMLTVYEGRYNSTIFAQLTRACKTVMDHPHHNREA